MTRDIDPQKNAVLAEADALFERGETDAAQQLLEAIGERGAEWEYLQAKIYRRRGWYLESRHCLERALREEPKNKRYRTAYKALLQVGEDGVALREKAKKPPSATQTACSETCTACCEAICIGCI